MFGLYIAGAMLSLFGTLSYQYTVKNPLQRVISLVFSGFFIFLLIFAALHF
jgi:hypothetical protein